MPDYTPPELQRLLAETLPHADTFRARCEAAVVQRRNASGPMFPLHPLDDEVDRSLEFVHGWRTARPPQWLDDNCEDGLLHGLDAEGRMRICGADGIEYSANWIDQLTCGDLKRHLLDDAGRIAAIWEIADDSCVLEAFLWQDEQVARSTVTTWLFQEGQWDDGSFIRIYDYEYDDVGTLSCVRRQTSIHGSPWRHDVVYSRPRPGQTLPGAFESVEDFLVEHIPLTVQKQNIESPLYAVLLTYCGEDITSGWPHWIYLMPEAHREHVAAHHPEEVLYRTWFTNELSDSGFSMDPCDAADFAELRKRSLQVLQLADDQPDFDYDELRKALCRVASRLNGLDWGKFVPVTDDFIVTAVDDHGETNPFLDWEASVPPEKLKLLQSRGRLPKPDDFEFDMSG
jgi:hypothetical protein